MRNVKHLACTALTLILVGGPVYALNDAQTPQHKASEASYDVVSALGKLAGMLVVLGAGGWLLVRYKPLFAKSPVQNNNVHIEVLTRKTVGYGLMASVIEVDKNKFLIVQDKQGHTLLPLKNDANINVASANETLVKQSPVNDTMKFKGGQENA